jgi:hypothetical protein
LNYGYLLDTGAYLRLEYYYVIEDLKQESNEFYSSNVVIRYYLSVERINFPEPGF